MKAELVRKNFKEICLVMPQPCPTAGQERAKSRGKAKTLAGTWWTKGKADTQQTRFGGAAKMDTRQDTRRRQGRDRPRHGGHMVDKADSGQTQGRTYGGHKADTWRTKFGGAFKVV